MRQLWNRCHNTGVALSLATPVSMAVPASLRGGETAARLRSHTASEDRIFSVTGATTALCDRAERLALSVQAEPRYAARMVSAMPSVRAVFSCRDRIM